MASQQVAIIGAGVIGLSWAKLFAQHQWAVRIYDPQLTEIPNSAAYVIVDSLAEAVEGVCHVQENCPEILSVKREIFTEIAKHVDDNAVLASSSSAILPSRIAEGNPRADQIIIGHPYNPPHVIPIVEVVPHAKTSAEILSLAMQHYEQLDRVPVALNQEIEGFVGNRLQKAILDEAYYLVQQGIVSPRDLDTIVKKSLGLRWSVLGVLEAQHLGGGKGGVGHILEHIGSSMQGIPKGVPSTEPKLVHKIVEDIEDTYGDESTYNYRLNRAVKMMLNAQETINALQEEYPDTPEKSLS